MWREVGGHDCDIAMDQAKTPSPKEPDRLLDLLAAWLFAVRQLRDHDYRREATRNANIWAAMPLVRLYTVLALVLLATGTAFILQSEKMPRFNDGPRPLYELLDPGVSDWPGGSNAWRREVDARRTDKHLLFDFGGSLVSTALTLFALAWNIATNKKGAAPRTPSSRLAIVGMFVACYVGLFYAAALGVEWDLERKVDPPWVDNVRIMNTGIVVGSVVFLLPASLFLLSPLLRRVELPQPLAVRHPSAPIRSFIVGTLYNALTALLALAAFLSFGNAGFMGLLPLFGLIYLTMCAKAIALAPRRARAGANAPALG